MTVTETRQQHLPAAPELTHREILEILIGLLAALFTAMLSSTIVSNALPTIIADLEGTQTQYTWVLTASLLATTVSTPIWGKLADLISKKLLVQLAISLFVVGSALAGLSHNVPFLIGARVLQGLAMGGLMALAQAIIGAAIPPRNRGRYSGYMGAVIAVATVSGPLIGGVIVDTSWLGWRWCFYVCVPLAVVSLVILQKYLHLPTFKREVRIDYLGAILISIAASLPLLWVTLRRLGLRLDVLAVGPVRRWHAAVRHPRRRGREPEPGAAGPAEGRQAADHRAGDRGQPRGRRRDVRQRAVPRSVLPDRPWLQPDRGRPADDPDDARLVPRVDRLGADDHPLRQVEAVPGRRRHPAGRRPGRCSARSTTPRRTGTSVSACSRWVSAWA